MEYQPLVCAKNERVVGVEALVRWHDPVYGHISRSCLFQWPNS
jgi:EAL domain-containing protein (putative c-di-GMP-specific phosphodiesterase class I)